MGMRYSGVTAVFLTDQTAGRLTMVDGESLQLDYFPVDALPPNIVKKAKDLIDHHLITTNSLLIK